MNNEAELILQEGEDVAVGGDLAIGIDEFTLVLQPAKRVPIDTWMMTAEDMITEFLEKSKVEITFEPLERVDNQLIQGYTDGFMLTERPFYLCICYNQNNENMGVCVKISATAYRCYKDEYFKLFSEKMSLPRFLRMTQSDLYSQRLSRVDLTADYFNFSSPFDPKKYLTPDDIYRALLRKKIKVTDHKGCANIRTSTALDKDGVYETVYIGSRKKSNTFLRIYDKRKEQIERRGFRYKEAQKCESWIRFEAVFRKTYANQIGKELQNNMLIQTDDDLQCFICNKIIDKYIFRYTHDDEPLDFSELLIDIASGQKYKSLVSPSPRDNELLNALFYIIHNSGLMVTLAKAEYVYEDGRTVGRILSWLEDIYDQFYIPRLPEGKLPELEKWIRKHKKVAREYELEQLLEEIEIALEKGENLNNYGSKKLTKIESNNGDDAESESDES